MCPEYVILSVPLAKIKSIPIVFWYCHGSISYKLKIAEKVVSKIVTSTPEGCRLNSNKIQIIGHGIDTDFFSIKHSWGGKNSRIVLLSVGRISPIKDYETIIESIKILKNQKELRDYLLEVKIVGGLGTEHNKHYLKELNRKISDYDLESSINFVGPVPFDEVSSYFKECDIFLSASLTGSLDKAVLEAMACEKPVLTCNEAFFDVLKDFRKLLIFEKKNGQELANKIKTLLLMSDAERKNIGQELRNIVVANHSINNLVGNIISVFNNLF
jgi:glycosyltransferase involved in cell wall biosynthesis